MLSTLPWYRVDHEWFNPELAYRAVWFTLPSESAWAYLTFISEDGHTYSVQVHRCTALRPTCEPQTRSLAYVRELTETEKLQPRAAKPQVYNPDLVSLDH